MTANTPMASPDQPNRLLAGDSVLLDGATELAPGWVEVSGDLIVAAGAGTPPRPPDEVVTGTLAPGFVDVHSHGGGGANFSDDPDVVLATHLRDGTTTMVASLVTGAIDELVAQIRALVPLVTAGKLAGIHLEGPFLAEEYKGAHPVDRLIDPSPDAVGTLMAAGGPAIKMITIAPERAGALAAIAEWAPRGVMMAVGHTAADYATAEAAITAGSRGATHLFNAMPDLLHRAPGPVLALAQDARVWLELVFDGVHVSAELAAELLRQYPGRVVLVTDAMAAAGAADGSYMLGELAVTVADGVARLSGTDTIAGSTLTLGKAVRTAISAGVDPVVALRAATCNPADYLRLAGVGRLVAGARADLVVLDDSWHTNRVMQGGVWQ